MLNAYKCPRFLPRDIFIVQSGMISLRITSERFVRCVEGTLGSCPKRLRRRSSIKGTSSGWRRMAINQINHLAIGSQMFQRKPPQMITLPKANVQQNSLKIPKGKIVSQPPFLRGYVSLIDCTIRTNSHAKKLSEFKLKLHFSTISLLGIPISDSIDLIIQSLACNFAGEPKRMKALWVVTLENILLFIRDRVPTIQGGPLPLINGVITHISRV